MVACHIGWRDFQMDDKSSSKLINRRTVLKMATTAGAAAIVSPRIVMAMGDQPVKFGVDKPLTGTYAITGRNERHGRSEDNTSEIQSLMRITNTAFCWKKKRKHN